MAAENHTRPPETSFDNCFEFPGFGRCFGRGALESFELYDGGSPEEKCEAYDIMLFNAMDCVGIYCLPFQEVSCEDMHMSFDFFVTGVENCTEGEFEFYQNCSGAFEDARLKIQGPAFMNIICLSAIIVAFLANNFT